MDDEGLIVAFVVVMIACAFVGLIVGLVSLEFDIQWPFPTYFNLAIIAVLNVAILALGLNHRRKTKRARTRTETQNLAGKD